jgi:DNA ligase-associated metallophosphoesterase
MQLCLKTPRQSECAEPQPLTLGSLELTVDASGALFIQDARTLIVADLHLEKGSSFARRGQMLPPYDTRATLMRLEAVLAARDTRTVIALGDSFHDEDGAGRLPAEDARLLGWLQRGRTWVWISGNHDPKADARCGGEAADSLMLGGVTLRHEPDAASSAFEIAGHLHPVARLMWKATSVRARCFASDVSRVVLPAFGAYAGGLNVLDAAFVAVFPTGPARIDMIGRAGVYSVPPGALVGDRG